MGFRVNRSGRVASADLSDMQQAQKLNATTSPPRARKASRAPAAAAAGCVKTSYIWLPLLLLSCCASAQRLLSLSFKLCLVCGAWNQRDAAPSLCSQRWALLLPGGPFFANSPSPAFSPQHRIWGARHHLENISSLSLRSEISRL